MFLLLHHFLPDSLTKYDSARMRQTIPHLSRLLKLAHAWRSPGKIWVVEKKNCGEHHFKQAMPSTIWSALFRLDSIKLHFLPGMKIKSQFKWPSLQKLLIFSPIFCFVVNSPRALCHICAMTSSQKHKLRQMLWTWAVCYCGGKKYNPASA